jgi:purine-binding chemotaxis protein CheW
MSNQLLSFELADELYAISITKVREILGGLPRVTRIPSSPAFLKGLINLRGAILPVVDLREELGLCVPPYGPFTVLIVVEVAGALVGLVVDNVVDVVSVEDASLQPPPAHLDVQMRAEFVRGLAEVGGRLLVLLDLDRVLTDEQIGILKSASAA